jgi:hypothetical protein
MSNSTKQLERGLILIAFSYVLIRIILFLGLPHHFYFASDDALGYIECSQLSIFDPDFFYRRPFIYPLFLKLFNSHWDILFWAQCLISTFAWLFMTYRLARLIHNIKLQYAFTITLLLFSCNAGIILWDTKLLTESLSTSLLAIFLGLYLPAMSHHFTRQRLILLILVGFLLVNIRDANVYFILAVSLLTLICSLFKPAQISRSLAFLFLVFSLISSCFAIWTANQGQRWLMPICNIMVGRMPETAAMRQYFLDHDMPIEAITLANDAKDYLAIKNSCQAFPEEDLHNWLAEDSKTLYAHFLLSHPEYVFSAYFQANYLGPLLIPSPNLILGYFNYDTPNYNLNIPTGVSIWQALALPIVPYYDAQPASFINMFTRIVSGYFPLIIGMGFNIVLCIILLPSIILLIVWGGRWQMPATISLCLFGLSLLILPLIVWHADAIEQTRHQLGNYLLINISFLVYLFHRLDQRLADKVNT